MNTGHKVFKSSKKLRSRENPNLRIKCLSTEILSANVYENFGSPLLCVCLNFEKFYEIIEIYSYVTLFFSQLPI